METENKNIHDFDAQLIFEYYSNFERQGIGSPEMTIKALNFIDNLTQKSKIADIGCGTGGQTMVLAQNTVSNITGIDLLPGFIDIFNENAEKLNLKDRVNGIVGSMDDLPFKNEEYDLIWSEGAIYEIGFERGLKEWSKYLKKGGFLAVSDASWFTEERPHEIENFWREVGYPGITTISNNVNTLEKSGYIPVGVFTFPENCWVENFYALQTHVQEKFLKMHKGNRTIEEFIAMERYEAEIYQKYKEYYGYVFYIGKKI